jgi:hypothetical protein
MTKGAGLPTRSGRLIDQLSRSKYGSMLFTTRSLKAATTRVGHNVVSIKEMNFVTAKGVLEKCLIEEYLQDDDRTAKDLLLKLTHLPLAIVQAAAYINKNQINLSQYAKLLDDTDQNTIDVLSEDSEDEGPYRDTKNPIATTWLISFCNHVTRVT